MVYFFLEEAVSITVPSLVEELVHPKCSGQPRGEAPLPVRFPLPVLFPLAIASNTAYLPATSPQEVFVKLKFFSGLLGNVCHLGIYLCRYFFNWKTFIFYS